MLTIRLISNLIYCKNTKNISYLTLQLKLFTNFASKSCK